jgi:hypothetical protein
MYVDWIQMAQDWSQWWAFVKTVTFGQYKVDSIVTNSVIISFSRKACSSTCKE